jgi:hypothetical protein
MATHCSGISALWLQKQFGLGSYKSAWLLCAKLRRARADPERKPLSGLVEADETTVDYRTRNDSPTGGGGRGGLRKLLVAGVDELVGRGRRRIRLAPIKDFFAASPHAFMAVSVAPESTAKTDSCPAYPGAPGMHHEPRVVGPVVAHVAVPWIHRVSANLKTWALGVYQGPRPQHMRARLDEFVFRFDRRRIRHAGFRSLLGIGMRAKLITYKVSNSPEATG